MSTPSAIVRYRGIYELLNDIPAQSDHYNVYSCTLTARYHCSCVLLLLLHTIAVAVSYHSSRTLSLQLFPFTPAVSFHPN